MLSNTTIQWPGWQIIRVIGHGGFGTVYEIKRDSFEEYAALKVITIPENDDPIEDMRLAGVTEESITLRFKEYMSDIVKEYSTMAKMKGHPNIVYCEDVRAVQHDDGVGWDIYIKMELLTPLKKRMDSVGTEEGIVDLGISMCNALVECEKYGITHRDIKPENIFVSRTEEFNFKLGDFGIARTVERSTSGTKIGTYQYMAPEIYHNKKYGASADQYSLGLVLYRLLNEYRLPFCPPNATNSDDENARKRRFDGDKIPAPLKGSAALKAIVLKACSYDPKERYANAAEMRDALKAVRDGLSSKSTVENSIPIVIPSNEKENELTFSVWGREKKGEVQEKAEVQTVPHENDQPDEQRSGTNTHEHTDQKTNRQDSPVPDVPTQENAEGKKKKRGIGAWIAMAAGLVIVIGGVLLLILGKVKDGGSQSDTGLALNNQTSETTPTVTKLGENLPTQLDWAEWTDEIPAYVTDDSYEIEERTLYRSRNLETTSSTKSDSMDGWELYDTAIGNGDYGAWSDWSPNEYSDSDTRQVETQPRYRYSDKETTTSNSSTMSGWTLEDTTYSWGDYGEWSDWNQTEVSKTESRDVQQELRYRYRDKETTTSSSSSLSGWTQYDVKTSWGDWGNWSEWSTIQVSPNDSRDVDEKKQYRYRDKETTTSTSSTLSGWTRYDSSVSYGSWGGWSDWTNGNIAESDTRQVETRWIEPTYRTEYNYSRYNEYDYATAGRRGWNGPTQGNWGGHYCQYYEARGWSTDQLAYAWSDSGYNVYGYSGYYWYNEDSRQVEASPGYTQYRYRDRSKTTTYYYYHWLGWHSWGDTSYSSSTTREVETRKVYRYRTRNQTTDYYYYRWKDWSSWSTTAVSGNENREANKKTFYRYRDRTSIPTYHFSRWKDWSAWSETEYSKSSARKVETTMFYRYRDRVDQTTYYFQRWTDWSNYTESPVDKSETVEVQTKTEYRYKSKS